MFFRTVTLGGRLLNHSIRLVILNYLYNVYQLLRLVSILC